MTSRLSARRQQILDLLRQLPICSPIQLAEVTNVSTETIRKDLDALSNEGLIVKVHGGVVLNNTNANEIPFDQRVTRNATEKKLIAKAAVQLISTGDAIILESCTTNLELAKALHDCGELLESLVVITNSLAIATVFERGSICRKLFLLGGWVSPDQYSTHGSQTAAMLHDFHVNLAFISGVALSDDYTLSGYYDDDVIFQKAAIQAANQTVLMLDNSKFNKAAVLSVAHLSQMDFLVTDKQLTAKEKTDISGMNVEVVQAGVHLL